MKSTIRVARLVFHLNFHFETKNVKCHKLDQFSHRFKRYRIDLRLVMTVIYGFMGEKQRLPHQSILALVSNHPHPFSIYIHNINSVGIRLLTVVRMQFHIFIEIFV